jgi:ABC-2 type transport system permease protein
MIGQVRSELRKVRSTQTVWWLTLLTVAFVALGVAASTYFVTTGTQEVGIAGSAEIFRFVLANIGTSGSQVIPLCLGILLLTTEFRHNTITATFLAEPNRAVVVAAKVVTILAVGAGIAVVATVVALVISLPWLRADGVDLPSGAELPLILLGNFLVLVLFGLLGLGFGAVIRNQIVAVVVAVLFVMLVEPLLVLLVTGLLDALEPVAAFLPGEAANALQRSVSTAQDASALDQLPMWGGGLVLLGYGLALLGIGTRFSVSRDVT